MSCSCHWLYHHTLSTAVYWYQLVFSALLTVLHVHHWYKLYFRRKTAMLLVVGSETLQGVGDTHSEHKIFRFMFGRHFDYIVQFDIDMTLSFYCLKLRIFVCAHNKCQKFARRQIGLFWFVVTYICKWITCNRSPASKHYPDQIVVQSQGCVISSVTSFAGSGILNEIVLCNSASEILNHRLGYLWQFHISWRLDSFFCRMYIWRIDTKDFCRKTLQIK